LDSIFKSVTAGSVHKKEPAVCLGTGNEYFRNDYLMSISVIANLTQEVFGSNSDMIDFRKTRPFQTAIFADRFCYLIV